MGSLARKLRRNQLKKELGTNKIKQAFHEEFETLEAKIKIVVLYNSVSVDRNLCPEAIRWYGIHKAMCYYGYDGKYHCYVVSTAKGFYLKLINRGYYFLSEHISDFRFGNIWVKNKREKLTGYDVSYTTDDENGKAFGHFTEGVSDRTLTYRDLKTGKSFTIDLNTGEKLKSK